MTPKTPPGSPELLCAIIIDCFSLLFIKILMSVPPTLMVMCKFAQTPMGPIHVAVMLGTDWLPLGVLVKVAILSE